MPDVFTIAKRSEVMSRIRSRGNERTELRLVAVFKELGITGWRRHLVIKAEGRGMKNEKLTVRPDFVFRQERVAVFVDGCFWHACSKCYIRPEQNQIYWDAKRETNAARDRKVNRMLKAAGWEVLRLWEHELRRSGRSGWRRDCEGGWDKMRGRGLFAFKPTKPFAALRLAA